MKKREFLKNSAILTIGALSRPALLPEEIEARPIMQEAKDPETAKGEVWAQPNPASQFAIIGYILPEGKKEAMLKVVDAYGRLLLVIPVNADKNNEMFNVAHWAAGTYYVYLEGNGWKSKANSFVVCN